MDEFDNYMVSDSDIALPPEFAKLAESPLGKAMIDVFERLKQTPYPVAFGFFYEEQEPPYIIFSSPQANVFYADGEAYYQSQYIQVELYSRPRNPVAESIVEAALTGTTWGKTAEYISAQDIYQTIYTTEV